jgi:hypothetical protein
LAAFEIRPRRATELVDASFQLLRRFYPQMLTFSAIAMGPNVLFRIAERDRLADPAALMANLPIFGLSMVLSVFCVSIADAVLVVAASEGYLEGSVDLPRALGAGAKRLLVVIGSILIRWSVVFFPLVFLGGFAAVLIAAVGKGQGAAATAGLLALVMVPLIFWWTIYAGLRTFAMTNAVLLERAGPIESLTRSWGLSKDCKAHIFFSLGLAWLLYFMIAIIGTVIGQMTLSPPMVGVLGSILIIPIYPLLAIVSTLLYYDLRIRKEGFDLELMSRDLGAATAPLPAA